MTDLYFENHKNYFHETWYKYKTVSDNLQRKKNENIPTYTSIVEPASGMARYRALGFRQVMHPSVNICDHPSIYPKFLISCCNYQTLRVIDTWSSPGATIPSAKLLFVFSNHQKIVQTLKDQHGRNAQTTEPRKGQFFSNIYQKRNRNQKKLERKSKQ